MDGDPDYLAFWNLVLNKPEETVYRDMKEALDLMGGNRIVIHANSAMLRGYFRENPFHQQELKVFGRERPTYSAVILNRNSPLKQVLNIFRLLRYILNSYYFQGIQDWNGKVERKWFDETIN